MTVCQYSVEYGFTAQQIWFARQAIDRTERHDFDHDFGYSFHLFSSLPKKERRGKEE